MDWPWSIEKLNQMIKSPPPRFKYLITDDKAEFIVQMEAINDISFKTSGDNLKYLEQLDRISQLKAGAEPKDVFDWWG